MSPGNLALVLAPLGNGHDQQPIRRTKKRMQICNNNKRITINIEPKRETTKPENQKHENRKPENLKPKTESAKTENQKYFEMSV